MGNPSVVLPTGLAISSSSISGLMTESDPMIALISEGRRDDVTIWSGLPAGLERGFRAMGIATVRVSADLPLKSLRLAQMAMTPIYRDVHVAAVSRQLAILRTRIVTHRLNSLQQVSGIVLIGANFTVNTQLPLVTFQDLTVPLGRRQGRRHSGLKYKGGYEGLPRSVIDPWVQRQGQACRRARGCCVASRWAGESVHSDYGIERDKIHTVGIGANLKPRPSLRKQEIPRFLWVGKDWERKGGPAVLRAFAALREEIPSARLDIAGGHPRVSAPGVVTHGTFSLGDSEGRARAISLFETATVFVMPSRFEPYGIVHVEAGSAGVPSIGTTRGGACDSVGPGGLLVDPGDEVGLVAAMRRLSDPETARVFGERALEHSKKNSWEAVADRVAGVLGPLRGVGPA